MEWMDFNKFFNKNLNRLIFSILITFAAFVFMNVITQTVFFINDDTNIMYTVAGYYTNLPADHPFINVCLSYFFQFLYTLNKTIPWYGVFHVIVTLFSIAMIIKVIFDNCYKKTIGFCFTFLLILLNLVILFIYPITLMQFTTTSALIGTAGIALLYENSFERNKKNIISILLSIICVLLSYMYRKNSAYIIIAFWGITFFYKVILTTEDITIKNLNKYIAVLLISILSLGVVIGINKLVRSSNEWDNYYKFDYARFHVQDYPHDYASDNPQLYEEIGWNSGLCDLTGYGTWSYFMMDQNINVETLTKIAETTKNSNKTLLEKISTSIESCYKTENMSLIIGVFFLSLLLVFCIAEKKLKFTAKNKLNILFVVTISLMYIIFFFYLCIKERIPFRAFQSISLPAGFLLNVGIIQMLEGLKFIKNKPILLIMLILLCVSMIQVIPETKALADDRYEKSKYTLAVEKYVIENPDNFYVYDTSLTFRYDPFVTYINKRPTNMMYWGGMGWKSPAYYSQLKLNGFDELYSDKLFNSNVYYVTNNDFYLDKERTVRVFDVFNNYMHVTYGNISVSEVDCIGNGIYVYKFEKQ